MSSARDSCSLDIHIREVRRAPLRCRAAVKAHQISLRQCCMGLRRKCMSILHLKRRRRYQGGVQSARNHGFWNLLIRLKPMAWKTVILRTDRIFANSRANTIAAVCIRA